MTIGSTTLGQVAQVSQAEAEAGTATTNRLWTAQRVKQAIDALGGTTEYILLEDQKATGTNGGTPTANAWNTRDLNTEVTDTGGNCTLSANRFTLAEGTYEIIARAPAYRCADSMLRLVKDPAGAPSYPLYGGSAFGNTNTSARVQYDAWLMGRFTVGAGGETYEIQQWFDSSIGSSGMGNAANNTSGIAERFCQVQLRKVS